ncbi:hypothetical protein VFPPC_00687 [Pochonia chlamydosporia 170]|uniref:Uncharacterized protein n=1 Tax=Pochonia chlamydosporia 170 TaxID=1380566 RepID=A0A179G6L6_METCM|nr:hypothetical protein VFPPC_00687 [Pochonia chlamydosporia 170]OAQ72819.1 hypothetical protein VFPPC_00687 [Pochonia chlamydosporia 170]
MASSFPQAEFFNRMAVNYARQTGNSTAVLFLSSWDDINALKPITSTSVIHDNAGGRGTATSVIVEKFEPNIPEILITDNNGIMVAVASDAFAAHPSITAQQMDSVGLTLPNNHYTHLITNFSIFLFPDPRAIRPDLPVMPTQGIEFMEEGVAAKTMEQAGFDPAKMNVLEKVFVATGDALDGLKEFLLTDLAGIATEGWSDQEKQKWPGAVDAAFKEEVDGYGGMRFEAWVVLAKK